MILDNHVNYVDTYFEYKTLTKIHGEPTFESIKKIKDELKVNTMAVNSEVGGGRHGPIGLVLTHEECVRISNEPYTRPDYSGQLRIPGGATQHEATRLRNEDKKVNKLFRKTIDLEKAFRYQITAAVPEEYLDTLRNREVNAITETIPTILQHPFDNYGTVEMEKVLKEEQVLRNLKYTPPTPLITIFNKIEDLQESAAAVYNPYTHVQLLNIEIQILRDSGIFTEGLTSWYLNPTEEDSWQNFKTHFQDELKNLKKSIRTTDERHAVPHCEHYIRRGKT